MRGAISLKLFLTLAALVLLPSLSFGQAGSFDPVFAGGSPLDIPTDVFSPLEDQVVLSNGKIVLLSHRSVNGRYVNRLTGISSTGEVDTTFGNNGFVDFAWSDVVTSDRASKMEVQNVSGEERIVVSGSWSKANGRKTPTRLLRMDRFLTNGELDLSFGTQGVASFSNTGVGSRLAIQHDGKILSYNADQGILARVLADGRSLDPSFGSSGILNVGHRGGEIATDMAGRIYVTGEFGSGKGKGSALYPGVVRFLANGAVDAAFGSSGRALVPFTTATARYIVIDGGGNIVLGGTDSAGGTRDFAVYRLTSAGAMDASFNGNGRSIFPDIDGLNELQIGFAVQRDGKSVLAGRAGYVEGAELSSYAVVRFNADGSVDTNFGDSGAVTWPSLENHALVNVTARCENEDCGTESLIVSGNGPTYLVVAKLLGN